MADGVVRDDQALLEDLADGDLAALRQLYERHAPWLSVRLTRRCNDGEVVADVLQDTFVAAWQGAGRYQGRGEVGERGIYRAPRAGGRSGWISGASTRFWTEKSEASTRDANRRNVTP